MNENSVIFGKNCSLLLFSIRLESGAMDISNIAVQTGDKKLSGNCDVPTVDYHVWAQIPWCSEKYGVCSDSELPELFSRFEERGLDRIVFELEDYCYVPTPP
ncbi:hypothetical protein Ddye_005472 [Dipteronia dyeriana]|uniref:Uncharacterized protein n=1 Tax=Dipteronia dyeriana TaxID=168575 RepID=A0AAD9XGB7_9ROSI|nr:hypothetical protein Ddye_005472 [Dipteronia dyeriana]